LQQDRAHAFPLGRSVSLAAGSTAIMKP